MENYNLEKEEEKSKKIKPLTLISGIFGVVIGIFLTGLSIFFAYMMLSGLFNENNTNGWGVIFLGFFGWIIALFLLLIAGLILVVAILNIVSGSLAIVAATKDDKKYLDRKGLIITSIVFDFILFVGLFIIALSGTSKSNGGGGTYGILFGVGALLALLSAVVKIVDISKVSKRYQIQAMHEKEQKKLQEERKRQQEEHSVEDQLTKYKQMLENGVITQEEYEKLRAKELGLSKEE